MVKALRILYEPSQSVLAQGKEVSKMKKRGYSKAAGGNGTFIMTLPAKVTLIFEVDGKTTSASVRSLICDVYSITRISEDHADRFFKDVTSGKIKLQYSEGSLTVA